ncbi:MAG: methyltransferase domain-containing protein [Syntrophales bacterium]|nr:methyltransferase domain-containing protein [Syntrophales bacterium]
MRRKVSEHYVRGELEDRIREVFNTIPLPEDTASLDEFHVRGREATKSLASHLALSPSDVLLDCGCGPGGALRWIAGKYGCRVIGVDITIPFLKVARYISLCYGKEEVTSFVAADALRLPFRDDTFSVIISQHVMMNLPDKELLLLEWGRILKDGGKVGLNEIVLAGSEPEYPLPWAEDRTMSYLLSAEEMKGLFLNNGFYIDHYEDTTDLALQWFSQVSKRNEKINLRLLMGEEMRIMAGNLRRALEDRRLKIVEMVARKKVGK